MRCIKMEESLSLSLTQTHNSYTDLKMDAALFSCIAKEAHQYLFFAKHQMFSCSMSNSDDVMVSGLSSSVESGPWTEKWAPGLLRECARAISEKDSTRVHHLLWILNELSSPYGDTYQKLAYCFLQALFCKVTASGLRCYRTLTSAAEKGRSFDSARKLILKFQEVSPWTTFGHVASNGALLEALDGEANLHVVDISNTLCTQWPTLLEALATRYDDTPRLRLTVVDLSTTMAADRAKAEEGEGESGAVMVEITSRMEKFARLMGVPFEMRAVSGRSAGGRRLLTREGLGIREGEAVAVNCVGGLRRAGFVNREAAVAAFRSLDPKVVAVVDEEADFEAAIGDDDDSNEGGGFVARFEECLRFYTLYFEMLEESFLPTSNEKLMLERECSRGVVRVLACDDNDDDMGRMEGEGAGVGFGWESETRETGKRWCERLRKAFSPVRYSDDVLDDVKALLKRYPSGWGLKHNQQSELGIYLTWKDQPVVWASAWKP